MTATEAAAARGIRVEPLPSPDAWGNSWQAEIPRRKGRAGGPPLALMLAETPDAAARMALAYLGARGWRS